MRQPGLIEMQRLDVAIEHVLEHFHVVQNTVIGALGDGENARLAALGSPCKRIGINLFLNVLRLEFLQRNRPDDAEMVARRRQKHRYRTGHDDGVQHRLVAVAIHHHDIVRRHVGMPHHLVGCGRAVGDEKTMIGIEDACGIALRCCYRTGVIQQLAELVNGVANVGAQHVLAKELVEHLPDRALQKCHPARVTRAVPGVRTVLGVMRQRAEKRWRKAIQVGACLANDVSRHKFRRVLEHVDEAMQLTQDVIGNVARSARFAIQIDRDIGIAKADFLDKGAQVQYGRIEFRPGREFLIVDRQDKGTGA